MGYPWYTVSNPSVAPWPDLADTSFARVWDARAALYQYVESMSTRVFMRVEVDPEPLDFAACYTKGSYKLGISNDLVFWMF